MAGKLLDMLRGKSGADTPEAASRMRHLDKAFLGEEEEEEGPKEGTGLLDDEPERAETDFFNGDKFVGETAGGKRHGHGVYYYDSGDKYTGQWVTGKQCGHGVYVYANGDRYVGQWENGKHNGEGTYYFKSGKVFTGNYIAGSPSGHGVFVYTNGERLDGEWDGSAYPEHGIYTYANGDSYGGSWKQGRKHGIGTYYFKSGAKYQGEYRNGEPHGNAIFIESDGRAFQESWLNGQRQSRTLISKVCYETGAAKGTRNAAPAAPAPRGGAGGSDAGATQVGDGVPPVDEQPVSLEDSAAALAASGAKSDATTNSTLPAGADTVVGGNGLLLM